MGRTEFQPEYRLRASLGWQSKSKSFHESEMALFYECMLKCAQKLLDTAGIVREAIFRQLSVRGPGNSTAFIDLPVSQT